MNLLWNYLQSDEMIWWMIKKKSPKKKYHICMKVTRFPKSFPLQCLKFQKFHGSTQCLYLACLWGQPADLASSSGSVRRPQWVMFRRCADVGCFWIPALEMYHVVMFTDPCIHDASKRIYSRLPHKTIIICLTSTGVAGVQAGIHNTERQFLKKKPLI